MRVLNTISWVDKQYQKIFQENGLDSFQSFYNCSSGRLVRGGKQKTIKYFSLNNGCRREGFYLKKQHKHLFDHVKALLRGREIPKSDTQHEVKLLAFYKANEIPVVETVAWGEQRCLGIPLRGYIVLQEVKGEEFVNKVRSGTVKERKRLIKAYGRFLGSLHSKGLISSKARVTDVICGSTEPEDWRNYEYVLIDREKGPLEVEEVEFELVSKVLADILVRFVLYIGMPSIKEIVCFLKAYTEMVDIHLNIDWKQLYVYSEKHFKNSMNRYDEQI